MSQPSPNQKTPSANKVIRRLAGALALGALSVACTPAGRVQPLGSRVQPVRSPSVDSANRVAGDTTGLPTPAPTVPRPASRPAPAPPTAQAGSPIPVAGADLNEADARLAELDIQLSEADRDLATQEGDL